MKLAKGKSLYFTNFGSFYFMKRNGEYEQYKDCSIPSKIEQEWNEELIVFLTGKILSGEYFILWNLLQMNISDDRKISICRNLSLKVEKFLMREILKKQEELFQNEQFYLQILKIFE